MRQGERTDLRQICRKSQSEAAELLNVSERSVRSAAAVRRLGGEELVGKVERGEMSVSAAEKMIRPERKPESDAPPAEGIDRKEHEANLRANRMRPIEPAAAQIDRGERSASPGSAAPSSETDPTQEPVPTNGDNNTHKRDKYLEQLNQWTGLLRTIDEDFRQRPLTPSTPRKIRKAKEELCWAVCSLWKYNLWQYVMPTHRDPEHSARKRGRG
jgi:hypothetical protein